MERKWRKLACGSIVSDRCQIITIHFTNDISPVVDGSSTLLQRVMMTFDHFWHHVSVWNIIKAFDVYNNFLIPAFFVATQFFYTINFIGILLALVLILMYLLCIQDHHRVTTLRWTGIDLIVSGKKKNPINDWP